ncbi:MAG: hypothetical protein ACJASR_002430 [Psychroserpens sp.]|jgi:hypothetical protein
MNEKVLEKYFKNQIDYKVLNEKLFTENIDLEIEYTITRNDLLKLCELTLNGKIDLNTLGNIAFNLIGSDFFEWDSNETDGEIISTTIFDWDNPELNYPLSIENLELWKQYLETGKYRVDQRYFYVELLKGDGHNDLLVEISKMNFSNQFDTYYFQIKKEPFENQDIKNGISELLDYWKKKIIDLKTENSIYLPIDFSDEYTGCFKLTINENDKIQMEYGFSRIEGYSISPSNPGEYYKSVKDFKNNNEYSIVEVSKKELMDSIIRNIKELKKNVG